MASAFVNDSEGKFTMRFKPAVAFTTLALALAGVTAVAAADRHPVHTILVNLPDGSVEQVRYTGDVAPRVVVRPVAAELFMDTAFGPDLPFAMMDRISAEMDAHMASLMHQAAMMQSMTPEQIQQAAMRSGGGAGATSFTMISTTNADGQVCSQSVRTVSLGDGKAPQIQRISSGDCAAVSRPRALTPTAAQAGRAVPQPAPAILPAAKAPSPTPDRNTI